MRLLLPLLLLAAPAEALWKKQGSSLVYFDKEGSIAGELPLGKWEEPAAGKLVVHEVRGGVSKDGRFAWTWDAQNTWNAAKTQRLERRNLLRYHGTAGQELWLSQSADAPRRSGEPVSLSDDGETVLVAARDSGNWRVEVRGYLGNEEWSLGSFPILESMRLTGNGRFAELRWTQPDEKSIVTVLELATKKREDVDAGKLKLGRAQLTDDGRLMSEGKAVFSF